MFTEIADWLDQGIIWFTQQWAADSFFRMAFNVKGMLAIILVSLICGSVGSLVVGNRMAFFSDALAHCAFAGVALGLLVALMAGLGKNFGDWITLIMIVFGMVVGLGIAWVKENTALANDTVIGVFFAGAIGLGAMVMKAVGARGFFNLEQFLFGDPLTAQADDLLKLLGLALVTALFLAWMYNSLVFTSFNASLARSRQIRIRLCNYLFIALLALIVNLCLKIVGALLINALLIVPAATAANLSRNLRQLFRWSIFLCTGVGLAGQWLNWEITMRTGAELGLSGTIVVLGVLLFFLSMGLGPIIRARPQVRGET